MSADDPVASYPPFCDYKHEDGTMRFADWCLVGEAGDYAVCDECFQRRTDPGKRGWTRIIHVPKQVFPEPHFAPRGEDNPHHDSDGS